MTNAGKVWGLQWEVCLALGESFTAKSGEQATARLWLLLPGGRAGPGAQPAPPQAPVGAGRAAACAPWPAASTPHPHHHTAQQRGVSAGQP